MTDTGRQAIDVAVVALAGIAATVVGLFGLQDADIGFTFTGAIDGIGSQIGDTALAALAIAAVASVNVRAGAVIVRFATRTPFASLIDMLLQGFAGAVLLDTTLLLALGSIGLFTAPVLVVVHVAVLVAGWRWGRPMTAGREPLRLSPAAPLALLVVFVWCAPTILQLASPVVPFADVLPNHVAPIEHIRTFGSFAELTTVPSPIYGPSRSFLGYNGLLGALSAMTRIEAAQAVAAFALPLSILTGVAVWRITREVFGRNAGVWALLTVPLTIAFLRISDLRSSVVALPLAATSLALAVAPSGGVLPLALCLSATLLVHPIIGGLTAVTIAVVAALDAPRRATLAIALACGLAAASPQAFAALGVGAPSWSALAAIPAAVGVGIAARSIRWPASTSRWLRPLAVVCAVVITVVALRFAPELVRGVRDTFGDMMRFPLLAVAAAVGLLVTRRDDGVGRRLIVVGIVASFAAASVVRVLPRGPALFESARAEVLSKVVEFWGPAMLALAAAAGLSELWERGSLPWRVPVLAFVVVSAFPFGGPRTIDVDPIEEARYAESLAIALHHAEDGFWARYPDTRKVIDDPRRQLIDVIRDEQRAGRITHTTHVLHVSDTFQAWSASPLAVFAGVLETSVSRDPERSNHTIGGRLHEPGELPALLDDERFDYVVVEGGIAHDVIESIKGAGFRQVYANDQGSVLVRTRD